MRIQMGRTRSRQTLPLTALLCLAAAPAAATEPDASLPASAGQPVSVAGIGAPVDSDQLDRLRGGDGARNRIEVDGEVGGNTTENVVSGGNVVDGGSFGNAAGISTVIQNSGSNVLIQNALIVNVRFVDPVP